MTRRRRWLVAAAMIAGCTDANLYGIDADPNFANKVSLQGQMCTADPSAVAFPLKILIAIDGSARVVADDPTATRAAAVGALMDRYQGNNRFFGIVQFGAQARSPTGGFADDMTTLQAGLDAITIGTTDTQRNFRDALQVVTTAIQDDLLASTPGTRSRTRYVVLFIAHGPPAPTMIASWCAAHGLKDGGKPCIGQFNAVFCPDDKPAPADCEGLIYPRRVAELRDYALANGAHDFVFHSISLDGDARANALLTAMATSGRGAFETQKVDALNLLRFDVAVPSSVLVKRDLVVYNPQAVLRDQRAVPDSDGDGLSDEEEEMLGTDPLRGDTDDDGLGDAVERLLGAPGLRFDPKDPVRPAECELIEPWGPPVPDSDLDGLNDCEEAVLRTDPSLVDSDRDGIPDLVEVRRGGNPLVDDLLSDSDLDGIANGDEMRSGLMVSSNDAETELELGYRYRFFEEGPRTRMEATPRFPLPGVRLEPNAMAPQGVGLLRYDPGPPATLSWTEDARRFPPGAAVDVSRGGEFTVTSRSDAAIIAFIDQSALPPPEAGARDIQILVKPTLRYCFHFDVRNITLVETAEVPGGRPGRGWNTLRIYLAQVPENLPRGHNVFSIATVPVRFLEPDKKTPDVPFIQLDRDSFVLLGAP